MKKILFTLLLLLCTTIGWAQTYTNVGTFDELKNALKDSHAKIKLTADIDITNLGDKEQLCSTFSGIIDGSYTQQVGGHTIYCSHKIYGGGNNKARQEVPLFGKLKNATIKNVAFCRIIVADDDNDNVGIIARQAVDQSSFINVSMESCNVYCDENRGGTMLGYAEDCTFQVAHTSLCNVEVNGVEGGGLVGHSTNCTYEMCFTSLDTSIFVDGNNQKAVGWCGGFVGYSSGDRFISGINGAFVCADESQVGGYTGESKFSTFTDCINLGTVAHCDYYDFEDKRYDRNKALEEHRLSAEEIESITGASLDEGVVASTIIGMMLSQSANVDLQREVLSRYLKLTSEELSFINKEICFKLFEVTMRFVVFGSAVATVVFIVVGKIIEIGVAIYDGDDETGGISGLASGGQFERCQNYGPLTCRDDNCGGIVGLGRGVTINNCFNAIQFKYDEVDTTGSILGAAEPNPDDDNRKCKVTNCLSTYGMHIVGDYYYDDGMDPTSGNNYRIKGSSSLIKSVDCEEIVSKDLIKSGIVAWWLNQGSENRSIGEKPWRKGIMDNIGDCSVFNPDLPEVELKDLDPFIIDSADKLIAYSQEVEKNQFRCGILTADINMAGKSWSPIGKAEQNKHFRGIFDGQGHKISGLEYTGENNQAAGLFGAVHAGAEIRNVIVENSEFTCKTNGNGTTSAGAGGIVGQVKIGWKWGNVFIENCGSSADINVVRHGGGILGNVITDGPNVWVYVNNCYSMGTVTASDGNSGLLCGYMKNYGVVNNCWSTGQLRTSDDSKAPYSIENPYTDIDERELLVGYDKNLDINNCYAFDPVHRVDKWEPSKYQIGVTNIEDFDELSNGNLTYRLNGKPKDTAFSQGWQQNLGTDAHPVFGNKGIYHTRDISSKYGTICLPYTVKSDDDIKYYSFKNVITDDGEVKLKFEYVNLVHPGIPALFCSTKMGEHTFTRHLLEYGEMPDFELSEEAGSGDWKMHSHPFEKVFEGDEAKTVYYVSDNMIRNAKKTTIAPFRAYFRGPSIETLTGNDASGAKSVRFILEDEHGETTALEVVSEDLVPVQQGVKAYSLMGTEVGDGYRGIVVKNGKKMIQNR